MTNRQGDKPISKTSSAHVWGQEQENNRSSVQACYHLQKKTDRDTCQEGSGGSTGKVSVVTEWYAKR